VVVSQLAFPASGQSRHGGCASHGSQPVWLALMAMVAVLLSRRRRR
jgi:uncharacterized protein (TIGR03382 family)